MAVKLDVLINYLFDNSKLKKGIADLNKQMVSAWSPYTRRQILNLGQRENLREYLERLKTSVKQFNDILGNTRSQINALNKKGHFQPFLEALGIKKRKNLKKAEVEALAQDLAYMQSEDLIEEKEGKEKKRLALEKYFKKEGNKKDKAKENLMKEATRAENSLSKEIKNLGKDFDAFSDLLEDIEEKNFGKRLEKFNKDAKEREQKQKQQQNAQNKQQKDFWNALFLRWGRLGVWGFVASQVLKYVGKAISFTYNTSMQGLDWQRTIRGGASGGSWFGQDIAGYQRAGIGAKQLQGFKRGIQGYIGSVKLGMGNAAPLMYLGLSALGDPDELERQLERSLRRLPKDVSLALAGQMGLDYNMWEAIYSGRIDRQKSAYSEEAMQKWGKLADSLNDLITNIKTFVFNLTPMVEMLSAFIDKGLNKGSSLGTVLSSGGFLTNFLTSGFNPASWGYMAAQMFKFGVIEVLVKDKEGNVIDRANITPMSDGIIEIPQPKGS